MGLSIVLIMLCHNSLYFVGNCYWINEYVKRIFQCGVDCFFILSGIGCYSSIKKNNVMKFYFRRMNRLIPSYLLVLIIWLIPWLFVFNDTLHNFLWNYCLLTFFIKGCLSEWYIAAIIVLYILTPVLVKVVDNKSIFVISMIGIIGVSLIISLCGIEYKIDIMISRVPAYLMGLYFGKLLYEGKNLELKKSNLLIMFFLILLAILIYMLICSTNFWVGVRLLFLPLAISLLFLLSKCEFHLLAILGTITLEIYLIHEKVLLLLEELFIRKQNGINMLFVNIVAIILSCIFAYLVKNVVTKIIGCFTRK